MTLRAAIFDFDGTVADTLQPMLRVLNGLAGEFGYRPADPEEIELLRGMAPTEVAKRLGVSWHKLPRIVTRAREELAHSMPDVKPFDGVADALAELRRGGLRVGLLTSNNRANVQLFLDRHPLELDFISTGSGLWTKHRRLARVLHREKLAREHAAYVGDEVRDIDAARKLGMRAVAVSWGYTKPQLLEENAPDRLVRSPAELVAALTRD
ncbi:MAG TPA: HAD-IA family hydrolase [Polyangiales bacterium]|nr:HAD-IA family hydrolase [Polyangiales bacterium]